MKLYSEGIELDSNNHVRKEKAHPAASYTNDETPNESIDYHTHTLPDAQVSTKQRSKGKKKKKSAGGGSGVRVCVCEMCVCCVCV